MSEFSSLARKERFARIIALVNQQGTVEVESLASLFSCSVETIRRDLRYLEAHGRLVRIYGGASTVQATDIGKSFDKRRDEHVKAKEIMAFKASSMISPGLTIFLDSSSTCYYLARALPDVDLNIVTNSMRILNLLKSNPRYVLIGTGGQIDDKHEDCILAPDVRLSLLDHYEIDLCFISCTGLDLLSGLYEMNAGLAQMKALLVKSSVHTVLLADSSKFDKKTPFFIGPMRLIDYAIDDGDMKNHHRQKLHELDINII